MCSGLRCSTPEPAGMSISSGPKSKPELETGRPAWNERALSGSPPSTPPVYENTSMQTESVPAQPPEGCGTSRQCGNALGMGEDGLAMSAGRAAPGLSIGIFIEENVEPFAYQSELEINVAHH